MHTQGKQTSALLTMAQNPGTLAGARCLAGHGVSVVVATDQFLAPAAWSHSTHRSVPSPTMDGAEAMLDWLMAFGDREPGMVLHPTCDNLAWLMARNRDDLAARFALYVPPFSSIVSVLDKRLLYEAAAECGMAVPETWFPSSEREAAAIAAGYEALVVKPRTQVFFETHGKGEVARGPSDVVRAFRAVRASAHAKIVREASPDIELPMLQEFLPSAAHCVYSISGFVDRAGRIFGARGAVKVLQRRALGVGLCFETAEVERSLVAGLERLCRAVGYFGIFEAEFIPDGSRRLLIDFNPRYYGQMGFDVARGAPLPWLLHLGALGREEEIPAAVEARSSAWDRPSAYRDEISLRSMLALGRIAGNVDSSEAQKWRRWLKKHRDDAVDASMSKDDVMPGLISALSVAYSVALHPRSSFRNLQK